MKSTFERSALLAGLLVLTGSLQFAFGIAGAPFALGGALLLGAGMTLLWLQLDLPSSRLWLPPLLLSSVVLLVSLILELAFRSSFAEWFCALVTAAGSGTTMAVVLSHRIRCNLCNRRLGGGDLTFRCPRCTQTVCEQTCWNFEHRRCQLCLEQRVSLLTLESAWWTRGAGPRMALGRCQVCQAGAGEADLRACPKCRRPQCRDCWDFGNGECSRCGAALPDLPPSLTRVIGSGLEEESYTS